MSKEVEIRLIAYRVWEQEGCLNGKHCRDWFKAESIWDLREMFKARQKKRLNSFLKGECRSISTQGIYTRG